MEEIDIEAVKSGLDLDKVKVQRTFSPSKPQKLLIIFCFCLLISGGFQFIAYAFKKGPSSSQVERINKAYETVKAAEQQVKDSAKVTEIAARIKAEAEAGILYEANAAQTSHSKAPKKTWELVTEINHDIAGQSFWPKAGATCALGGNTYTEISSNLKDCNKLAYEVDLMDLHAAIRDSYIELARVKKIMEWDAASRVKIDNICQASRVYIFNHFKDDDGISLLISGHARYCTPLVGNTYFTEIFAEPIKCITGQKAKSTEYHCIEEKLGLVKH